MDNFLAGNKVKLKKNFDVNSSLLQWEQKSEATLHMCSGEKLKKILESVDCCNCFKNASGRLLRKLMIMFYFLYILLKSTFNYHLCILQGVLSQLLFNSNLCAITRCYWYVKTSIFDWPLLVKKFLGSQTKRIWF